MKGLNEVFFVAEEVAERAEPGVERNELVYPGMTRVYSTDSSGSPIPTIPPVGLNAYVEVVIIRVPIVGPPVANTRV